MRLSSTSSSSSSFETTSITNNDPDNNDDKDNVYQELQRIASEIRRHDEIYYLQGTETEISDDAYDALCAAEAALCRAHPDLLQQLQVESGLGQAATRFGGRVGPAVTTTTTTADRFRKRQHLAKMYSLNNAVQVDQVLAWLNRIRKSLLKKYSITSNEETNNNHPPPRQVEFLTEPKLDGLSLSLRYKRQQLENDNTWKLEWAATRGDGKQGQDVTVAVQQGLDVPQTFEWSWMDDHSDSDTLEVRGEVVLPETVFAALKSSSSTNTTFSNARNAASGILLRSKQVEDDAEVRKLRKSLRFYAYGVVGASKATAPTLPNGVELREQLTALGFRVPQPTITTVLMMDNNETEWTERDIQPMLQYHAALQAHKQTAVSKQQKSSKSKELTFEDYGMDGCVHKVVDEQFRKDLGHTPRAPRWAIAHKFAAETVVTRLMAVELQVGRTGALTPVAKLEPVELNGVLIQSATLHNFGHMQQALGSDCIPVGTSVLVRRAGEVIPQVLRRVDSADCLVDAKDDDSDQEMISLQMPDKCPACGSPVAMDEVNRTNSKAGTVGQVLRCVGPPLLCQPRAVSGMAHAFSRDALDITGISQARLEKLMDLGFLRTPADLFLFAKNKTKLEELMEVDGWGEKSVGNLADKVNSVAEKGVSLTRFIYSLGIRFVGLQSSELIAAVYGKVDDFVTDIQAVKELEDPSTDSFSLLREENEATKGIGPVLLSSLVDFAMEPELVKATVALSQNIKVHEQDRFESDNAVGTPAANGPLAGLKVVFTGTIPGVTRPKAKEMAKAMGAKSVGTTVSKSTDLVVAGAKGGKKLQEADNYGIRVISGQDFVEMINEFNMNDDD